MASRRGYITTDELNTAYGITATDAEINRAEELIDSYVGFQDKALSTELTGMATAGAAATLTLPANYVNAYDNNYLAGKEIEILSGTGAGQRRTIASSTRAGVLTVSPDWTTQPDATSLFRISQLGKFPRIKDRFYHSLTQPAYYYHTIPEPVRAAVAAQVEYMQNTDTNEELMESEHIDDYSYTRADTSTERLISPKAKALLRGYRNRKGRFAASDALGDF